MGLFTERETDNKSSNGLGFTTILFLIFMTLKLAGFINWSWWWVTSPIWIPFVSVMVLVIIALMYKK
jgi:fatty acid desaturase